MEEMSSQLFTWGLGAAGAAVMFVFGMWRQNAREHRELHDKIDRQHHSIRDRLDKIWQHIKTPGS